MKEHTKHFWKVSSNWNRGHALIMCMWCEAVGVTGYGEGLGPCPHGLSSGNVVHLKVGGLSEAAELLNEALPAPQTGRDALTWGEIRMFIKVKCAQNSS